MKIKTLILLLLLITIKTAHADWYIFNSVTNRAIAKIKYLPSSEDLATRGEFAFFSNKDVPIGDAEFFGNDVRVRAKSQEEKNSEDAREAARLKRISDQNSAKEKLIILGLTSDEVDSLK